MLHGLFLDAVAAYARTQPRSHSPPKPPAPSAATARATGARSITTRQAAGLDSQVCAVLGSQWGDEGKGKLVDVLARKCVLPAR